MVVLGRTPFYKMTRINLVPVTELANQHLLAEWREAKMVPKALSRSLRTQSVETVAKKIPAKFTLNTGHVLFFYDKGAYLQKRYAELTAELVRRGFKINVAAPLDPEGTMDDAPWNNDYEPTEEAIKIIRQRISEKIAMKPDWYRWTN
ncbi:endonuclease V [Acanthocystis turfacea Chlorella virus NE-JV-2]|nr:endonuclease V [Acanthocystis turfacea Chlorella virus NE-JV-2]